MKHRCPLPAGAVCCRKRLHKVGAHSSCPVHRTAACVPAGGGMMKQWPTTSNGHDARKATIIIWWKTRQWQWELDKLANKQNKTKQNKAPASIATEKSSTSTANSLINQQSEFLVPTSKILQHVKDFLSQPIWPWHSCVTNTQAWCPRSNWSCEVPANANLQWSLTTANQHQEENLQHPLLFVRRMQRGEPINSSTTTERLQW